MSKLGIASRIAGIGAAAILAYNAHKDGVVYSRELPINNAADSLTDLYAGSLRGGSSELARAGQKWYVDRRLKLNIFQNIDTVKGYIFGGLGRLRESVVLLGLSTAAILGGKKCYGKAAGIGLLLYGLNYLIFDVMQLGRKSYFKK